MANTKCCVLPDETAATNSLVQPTVIYQGSTPIITFKIDIELTNIKAICITFSQLGKMIFERNSIDNVDIEERTFTLTLSQQETLALSAKYSGYVQVRILYNDNKAFVSEIGELYIEKVLHYGVLEEGIRPMRTLEQLDAAVVVLEGKMVTAEEDINTLQVRMDNAEEALEKAVYENDTIDGNLE